MAIVYRLQGHARTLTEGQRCGRQQYYTASCECGWTDRPRAGMRVAKDFHVAHLQDAVAVKPEASVITSSTGRPSISGRRLPSLAEVWALASSGARWTVVAVDPEHYKQRAAGLLLRSVDDPRVTRRVSLPSFLARYRFLEPAAATAAYPGATFAGAICG